MDFNNQQAAVHHVPFWFFVMEAAPILNMSYPELEAHEDKAQLMSKAFTYAKGKSDGEYLLRCNEQFQREIAERARTEEKVRAKAQKKR